MRSTGLEVTGHITASGNISSSGTVTANAFVGSFTGGVTGDATGLTGTPDITVGNVTATGTITAQEFHTEFVSASIVFSSGSTKFGDSSDDIHQFSGSLRVTGSGDHYFSDGNVGIGTTSPSNKLTVDGTVEVQNNALSLRDTTSNAQIKIQSSVGGDARIMAHDTNTGNDQDLNVVAKEIDFQTGLVSGGTNVSTLLLDSSNNATFAGDITASGNISASATSTGSFGHGYFDGNVGIGTSSPAYKLHIVSGDEATLALDASTGQPAIFWTQNGSSCWEMRAANDHFGLYDYTLGAWHFYIKDGKIGIGTTAPVASLEVKETGTIAPALYIDTVRYGASIIGDGTSNSQYLLNLQSNGGSTDVMRVQSSGNVGIGTTAPASELHVNGAATLTAMAEPSDPTTNDCVIWLDSTTLDVMVKITGESSTVTRVIASFEE
jgi:hypothetical protein